MIQKNAQVTQDQINEWGPSFSAKLKPEGANATDPKKQEDAVKRTLEEIGRQDIISDPNAMKEVQQNLITWASTNDKELSPILSSQQQTGQGTVGQQPSVSQPMTASYSPGIRGFLNELNNRYSNSDLDFIEALKVWKQAGLTPDSIRSQVRNDVGKVVSFAEAKVLHKIGSDLIMSHEDIKLSNEIENITLGNMMDKRSLRLTPSIRASVERIGQNLFRTKNASMLWKIDMKYTDDGQQIPYLVRVDVIEAGDEDGEIVT